ncbi:sensor histidine kinase [Galliscardovia ingluviei]|nr:HAMP domain-containing sensor histidine kinase [Galliscardovia ingluviei]
MGSEHITPITIIILLVFAVMAVIALGAVLLGLVHMFASAIPASFISQVEQWREDMRMWWHGLLAKLPWVDEREDSESDEDDLNAQATRLLAMLPMVAVLTDDSGRVLRANPKAYQFGVVDDDVIIDERIAQAVAQVRHTGGSTVLQVVTQTPKRYEQRLDDEDEHGASEHGVSASLSDETALRIEVSRRNWLDVTVGSLGSGLVAVLIRDTSAARRFARVQEDFVTNVSQRLLEPMRALKSLGDDLSQDDAEIDQVMASAGKVHDYASVTAHILDDLLLLIQAQTPIDDTHGEVVDINDVVRGAVDDMGQMVQYARVEVRVRYSQTIHVEIDAHQVRAAVACLLANGIIYSPSGSSVDVVIDTVDAVQSASGNGRVARVRVIDRGVGIATQDLPHVFKRFYRGSNQPHWPGRDDIEHGGASGGVGLGLAIVKHVALTHGGSALAWSRPGSGSTFTLTVPALP